MVRLHLVYRCRALRILNVYLLVVLRRTVLG